MDFAQHLVRYYKGEWLEAILLMAFGITTTGLAVVMWQHAGQNVLLKGLFYPIVFFAAFTALAGGFCVYNNSLRLATMPAQYVQNQVEFVQAEQNRFEGAKGVNTWWMPLKVLWAVFAIGGIAVSFTTRSDFIHGIAIGFIVIGAMGFVIDGFAHHRAKVYTAVLLSQNVVQP
ncbi:hypothetical protein [Rheinheimera baltica]|uniref:hypothetical protein n=1 Tax=Rheinheimera baltica TaxID=67576 RepID=UPI0003F5F4D9|nr:hypothetical protein [Rheinheimera baltica]